MNIITLEQMDSIQQCIAEQERQKRKQEEKRKNLILIFKELAKVKRGR